MIRNHKGLAVIVLTITFLSFAFGVFAVTVGPARIEIKANPGDTLEGRISVFNETETAATFWADFEKFIEVDGERKFLAGEETELANWFQMEKTAALEPKQRKDISYTINVPENAPPGGHFAVIWWGTAPPQPERDGRQVAIFTRAGILVFLQISGEVNEKGEVLAFSLPKERSFVFQLPDDFYVEFKNEGNTYLKPLGEIIIKNIFGSKVVVFSVNEKKRNILPQDTRFLEVAKPFEKPPFAFGLYRAELNLEWGEEANSFHKNIYFFVLPWKAVLAAISALAILVLLLAKGIKKYNQWVIAKAKK